MSGDEIEMLQGLKTTFEKTLEDVSSAKDIKKKIDELMTRLPTLKPVEEDLQGRFSQLRPRCEIQPSNFRSIRDELSEINKSLLQRAAEANQTYRFEALSDDQNRIIEDPDNDTVECLRVSYDFLHRFDEVDPRICLFMAIFPENAILRKRFLIYWWIGEGLVRNEDEGERAFDKLLDLELITPYPTDKCPRVTKCQILPSTRCMLISAAKKEKLLYLEGGRPCFDLTSSRHACLIHDHYNNLASESGSILENLRTIFNVNKKDLHFQHQWLAKLKSLVVLQLGRWQVSPTHHIEVRGKPFLSGLKTQKHLKYLSLRGISRINALPDSIKELVSLEILDLKACHNLETLPAAIASLKKLTHLDVSECYLLESMPKGLDKLTSLQVLKGFIIGNSHRSTIRIKHLVSLKNLKRLRIHIGSEASIQYEEFEKLKDLKKVKCLKISWGTVGRKDRPVPDPEPIILPLELEKLDLEGIPHTAMPEWLKPSKLRKLETLYIKGGKLENLDHGQQEKWNLKHLVLKYTEILPTINEEVLKPMFPSLQYAKKVVWEKEGEKEFVQEWEGYGDEKVVLRYQDMQGKKDEQGLLNNVIEETVSKLDETTKTKGKALLGAL